MYCFRYWTIFVAIAGGLAGCNNGSTPAPIVVGHVSDKSRVDNAGLQAERGIRQALHDLSRDGALADAFGGKAIQVNHTNTNGNAVAFEAQAVRLYSVNRSIAILGGMSAAEVTGLDHVKAPILTFHGNPVIGASKHVFYLGMSPARQGEILAKVLAENAATQRFVVIQDERSAEATVLANAFQKTLLEVRKEAKAESTVLTLRFGQASKRAEIFGKEEEWREISDRMLTPTPHAAVFAGSVGDFNAWRKVLRSGYVTGDLQIAFAGPDGGHEQFDCDAAEKTDILLATAFHADPASDKIAAFQKAMEPGNATVHAALAYDGMRILVEAMKNVGPLPTPDRIHEALLKTKDFPGLNGPLTITEDRQVRRTLFAVRWQGKTSKLIRAFP